MLNHHLVVKGVEAFLVGDPHAEGGGAGSAGLYWRDTRYLHRFELSLAGITFHHGEVRERGPMRATITCSNAAAVLPDGTPLPTGSLVLDQHVALDTHLLVGLVLHNRLDRSLSLMPCLELAADFRDLFEIRGEGAVRAHGRYYPPAAGTAERPGQLVLRYVGLDGVAMGTAIALDPPPAEVAGGGTPATSGVRVSFATVLAPGQAWELDVRVTPLLGDVDAPQTDGLPRGTATALGGDQGRTATIRSTSPAFNRLLERSTADLASLETRFPEGCLPAAGIPWYVAPFGRDSLITGLQTLHLAPQRAISTLRVLAALQGTEFDPRRHEEPGKILHEKRYGELARSHAVPQVRYYGTADATPLFVLLFAETVAWTGDEGLYRELLPNVRRALGWIEGPGDPDGDGLIEYQSRAPDGVHIINQGWKDSPNSLHHVDGRLPTGLVASVEVQGYVYAAYRRLAEVAATRGEEAWADELRAHADATRRKVEDAFWLEAEGFYAQALDGDKRPFRTISSNPGHLLFCGLPSPQRAAIVVRRLQEPDMDSGWGIRTLSASTPTYDPLSYHNGTVWPHDNSLIAAGLREYGHAEAANRIAEALIVAANTFPLARLPELYCGFGRGAGLAADGPVAYPVSCSPQAWAAAAVPFLVRTMLGLALDLERGRLIVAPALPAWLDGIEIRRMTALGTEGTLRVTRDGGGYRVNASDPLARVILSDDARCVAPAPRQWAAVG